MSQGQQLVSLLRLETTHLQHLLDALELEFESLKSGDVEAIEKSTQAKNKALAKQAEATLSRQRFVATTTANDSEAGLQQLITHCENSAELSEVYEQLTSLATQCQNTNRINGRLILQKQQQTRSALNIIRQADNETSTYSGQGGNVSNTPSRTLGKA